MVCTIIAAGGGGGLASTGDFGHIRHRMGKIKAEQIRKTGARTVVTGCFNCRNQIRDIGNNYELGIEVKSIVEVVAGSII
jgi:Fe-S oxidoreductase